MQRYFTSYLARIFLATSLFIGLVFHYAPHGLAQQPDSDVLWDKAMQIPSPEETSSWFPDLAVDSQGRVHVIWDETDHFGVKKSDLIESVYYSMWDGQQWTPYNDLVPPQPDIIRQAIAIDGYDVLHFISGWFSMYYQQARAGEASSAAAWTSPELINFRKATYMKDIAIFENQVHVVYDDAGADDENIECVRCGDIFYRRSNDLGLNWSPGVTLFPTGTGSARVQLEIDKTGALYVTWDEGWDRFSDHTSPQQYGVYMHSVDGGDTWSSPTSVTYPNSSNVQLTVGADGQDGVLLVWRTISPDYPHIYYMWSKDHGQSWSPPRSLPNFVARKWNGPFDKYDMATDSAGHIHLLAVGHVSSNQDDQRPPGLYHFEWDGQQWSAPAPVYQGLDYPEYPHLVTAQGNQFHATWFTREVPLGEDKRPHLIWYAHGQSSAPVEQPRLLPTFTPTPQPKIVATSTPTPSPTPSPTPTLDPDLPQDSMPAGAADSIYTESDDLLLLAQSLLPAILIIVVIIGGVYFWRHRGS